MRPGQERPRAEQFLVGGVLAEYPRRVHMRVLADLYFLARWRVFGQAQAGAQTCERFGHEAVGGRCIRCGAIQTR